MRVLTWTIVVTKVKHSLISGKIDGVCRVIYTWTLVAG
jgi:hypothetical protein